MSRFDPYSLAKSFGFALRGVRYALTRERNLRIHFAAGAFALYCSSFYAMTKTEYALLLFAVGFVLVCEMINTAIEKTVDLETTDYHRLARIAKDVAAGAVLVAALTSLCIGFLLFWDPVILRRIGGEMLRNLPIWVFLVIATVVWVWFPWQREEKKIPQRKQKRDKERNSH